MALPCGWEGGLRNYILPLPTKAQREVTTRFLQISSELIFGGFLILSWAIILLHGKLISIYSRKELEAES